MKNLHIVALIVIGFLFLAQHAAADWTNLGNANGVQVYRDNDTGLEWTATIGQVQSSGWGAPARSLVARYGFRLPSFRELQVMEAHGGFRPLQINTRMQQYYETSNSNVLAAAWGNGFRTPQQRKGTGRNWVIGVRQRRIDPPPPPPPPPGGNNQSKIHMLFVWGTKAEDVRAHTMLSKEKIERAFATSVANGGIGFSQRSPLVGTYETLEGDNAHPKNILDSCQRISQKAGPNDAVFVYILCHGGTVVEDNDPNGTRIHALSPAAVNADNLDLRTIGIRRSSIMRAIKSHAHRLDVLITDACAIPIRSEGVASAPRERRYEYPGARLNSTYLLQLLRFGRGSINFNSSSPQGGLTEEGELALSWVPQDWQPGNTSLAGYEEFGGTIFTNAFLEVAKRVMSSSEGCSPEQFYTDLKQATANQYTKTTSMMEGIRDVSLDSMIMNQDTQTVTRFDDWGVAIKE